MSHKTVNLPASKRDAERRRAVFRLEKALDSGYQAWQRGDVNTAVKILENVLAERPGAIEALFPLARALHEKGESDRAITVLDGAIEDLVDKTGALSHRAIIRFDVGDDEGLNHDVQALGSDNPMANALRALAGARCGDWKIALLPAFSLWNAELVGRLLAILEDIYAQRRETKDDFFHHRLFSTSAAAVADVEGSDTAAAPTPLPKSFSKRAEWVDELIGRFDTRDFDAVLALTRHKDLAEEWLDESSSSLEVFASLAREPIGKTLGLVDKALATHGPSLDLHFLRGLALIRDGKTSAASHAFVRAARSADTVLYDVVTTLARELDISLERE